MRAIPWFGLLSCLLACALISRNVFALAPSTFGTTVGHTLLCLNQLDSYFFYDYFKTAFGKPYKHEGGAYWFKADATLWGAPVTDVLVSDDESHFSFLAAVLDVTPEKLDESVIEAAGIHHQKLDSSKFPVRQANPGSQIVYFQKKSKIFCAKSKLLRPN
mgnify:CR=1 FL=1